jgi:rubrerythrin
LGYFQPAEKRDGISAGCRDGISARHIIFRDAISGICRDAIAIIAVSSYGGDVRAQISKDGCILLSDFSPVQAFKIAKKMEQDGIQFYKDLLETLKDEEARREIGFLIEQEQQHLDTFVRLLKEQKEETADGFEEDDIIDYMNASVFEVSERKGIAGNMDHRHTALEEALNLERRSIVFYEACVRSAAGAASKKSFEKIIEEEQSHLKKFGELLRVKCIHSRGGCVL